MVRQVNFRVFGKRVELLEWWKVEIHQPLFVCDTTVVAD